MLNKQQKSELVAQSAKKLQESKAVAFAEFSGISVCKLSQLRRELKKVTGDFKVIKKRLLDIALKKTGINFSPDAVKTQLGTIFSKSDLVSVAPVLYKFAKEIKKGKGKEGVFEIVSAYDAEEKKVLEAQGFSIIATLLPREALLAQIAMMLTMPLKQIMNILEQRSKTNE